MTLKEKRKWREKENKVECGEKGLRRRRRRIIAITASYITFKSDTLPQRTYTSAP